MNFALNKMVLPYTQTIAVPLTEEALKLKEKKKKKDQKGIVEIPKTTIPE